MYRSFLCHMKVVRGPLACGWIWSRRKPAPWSSAILEARLPVSRLPLPPPLADASPFVQSLRDCAASMHDLSGKEDLTACVIDHRQALHPASGIKLDPQWIALRSLHSLLEDDRKRVPFQHSCVVGRKQPTSIPWMDGTQGTFPCIDDEDLRHGTCCSFQSLRQAG
jgi:hypothetical protein